MYRYMHIYVYTHITNQYFSAQGYWTPNNNTKEFEENFNIHFIW